MDPIEPVHSPINTTLWLWIMMAQKGLLKWKHLFLMWSSSHSMQVSAQFLLCHSETISLSHYLINSRIRLRISEPPFLSKLENAQQSGSSKAIRDESSGTAQTGARENNDTITSLERRGYPLSWFPQKSVPEYNNIEDYQYSVVIDFEATCYKGKNRHPQEIIEFPSVTEIEDCFQTYVRPTHNKQFTIFRKDLTGIQQSQLQTRARIGGLILEDYEASKLQ